MVSFKGLSQSLKDLCAKYRLLTSINLSIENTSTSVFDSPSVITGINQIESLKVIWMEYTTIYRLYYCNENSSSLFNELKWINFVVVAYTSKFFDRSTNAQAYRTEK